MKDRTFNGHKIKISICLGNFMLLQICTVILQTVLIMILYRRWQLHVKFMKVGNWILHNTQSFKLFVNTQARGCRGRTIMSMFWRCLNNSTLRRKIHLAKLNIKTFSMSINHEQMKVRYLGIIAWKETDSLRRACFHLISHQITIWFWKKCQNTYSHSNSTGYPFCVIIGRKVILLEIS